MPLRSGEVIVNDKRVARHYAEALFYAAQKWGARRRAGREATSLKQIFEEDAELRKSFLIR